jgi:hypothetical protein
MSFAFDQKIMTFLILYKQYLALFFRSSKNELRFKFIQKFSTITGIFKAYKVLQKFSNKTKKKAPFLEWAAVNREMADLTALKG